MADDYTPTQPGTEGMDFHLTDEDRAARDEQKDVGPQPGTEGMDFHLTEEDRAAASQTQDAEVQRLVDTHTASELDELAENHNVSSAGTKTEVARRLVQAGYSTPDDGTSDSAYSQEIPTKTAETTGPAGAPAS